MAESPIDWQNLNNHLRESSRPVTELWEFVRLVTRLHGTECPHGLLHPPFLFRGQRHRTAFKLRPMIGRSEKFRFAETAERNALMELKRIGPLLVQNLPPPQNDLEWLCLGQHHGLATRLLDWTENALAALWFAIHEVGEYSEDPPVVWAIAPTDVKRPDEIPDPFRITQNYVVCPPHSHSRVRAQEGWFTLHYFNDKSQSFPPLDSEQASPRFVLGRIDIEAGHVAPLRRELRRCGIHAGTVFPDFGGLCQRITEEISPEFFPKENDEDE
jgi:hypothetical protein